MEKLYQSYTSSAVFSKYDEQTFSQWGRLCFQKQILPHLPENKDIHILEIGCGYGRYLKLLNELQYHHTYGIDISEEQIQYAVERLKLQNVAVADALEYVKNIPRKYDIVLMLDVMEHLSAEYAIELSCAIHSILNPNGKIIIQVPNAMCPMAPMQHGDLTHRQAYSPFSMKQLLISAGFSQMETHSLPPLVHGIKSWGRRTLWNMLFQPLIKFYMLSVCGHLMGGIYTPNFLTIAVKNSRS